jgi:predicted ATPase/transcriptional regulator with XRE-family HTH domain
MNTRDAKATSFSSDEDDFPLYFSEWLKHRRQELDLTQEQLAQRASCSVFAIRKMEAGARRPSRQLAGFLAKALEIPAENQPIFIQVARGERSADCLYAVIPSHASLPVEEPRPTNGKLPRSLTPFIGRDPELTALGKLLSDPQCSLITIAGPGGIGKTRLAIQAAQHIQDLFPDGIWFVPLASLNSPALIVPTIADAVDFKFSDPTNHQAQLLRYLDRKKALLVLDNAEHLLNGVEVFTEILKHCPQVKLLITSRERLNLLSEWVFEVQGLPVPANDQVEQMETYSSVALFLQSARRVRAGFELGEECQWVRKICAAMGGMPLGIELSAAWVALLSCEEIAKEIERNLDFLTAPMRDLPERHRSMRATLDHSWKLLNDEEKSILSRLSVFHSHFRRAAAQEICGANSTVLSSLRNKALLYRTDQDYFSLHELVRQYAERKLAEDPAQQEWMKDRHASYYVHCLSEWEKALKSPQQLETFDEMVQVVDDLSRGWQRMITTCRPKTRKGSPFFADLLHGSLFSLSLFYESRCRSWEAVTLFTESVEYLRTVQGQFEKTEDSYRFNSVLGLMTAYLGLHHAYVLQYAKAREYLEEALELLENSQSWIERAQAQIMLGSIYYRQGKYQRSAALLEQGRNVFRAAGERWWYLLSTINLARTYLPLGKVQEGEALCQEGFRLIETGDVRLELPLRNQFAFAGYLQHDYVWAEQVALDSLELSYQYRNHRMTATIYIDLSKVALATDRVELAEKYLQESIRLLSQFGESDELAYGLLYLGKCFITRLDIEAALRTFRQVIKIGTALDMFYVVYWGLVNIARTYLVEGQIDKALEISLLLKDCSVEYKIAQDEGNSLLADLQGMLPKEQVEVVMKRGNVEISADQAEAVARAYALEQVTD